MIEYLTQKEYKQEIKRNPESPLTTLVYSDRLFYLCGSRRMAQRQNEENSDLESYLNSANRRIHITKDTDYDFYVTYTSEIEKYLIENGFERALVDDYLDDEACAIFCNDNVQVVLRKDSDFYRHVFETISPDFFYSYIWKSSPQFRLSSKYDIRDLMNQMFHLAAKGR